jgi:hypothetical protein
MDGLRRTCCVGCSAHHVFPCADLLCSYYNSNIYTKLNMGLLCEAQNYMQSITIKSVSSIILMFGRYMFVVFVPS